MGSSAGSTLTARAQRQARGGGAGASAGEAPSTTPVFLNVYDVTPANGYARWLGLGVYHSGVQGTLPLRLHLASSRPTTAGIFEVVPRRCPGYAFRESVLVGETCLSRGEVRALMAELAAEFPGDAYNLVSRNCNHFCDAACRRLVRRARIPRWVNRLAKIGVVFTCVIPGNGRAVRRAGECPASSAAVGKAGIRSRSARQEAAASAPPRPRTFFRSLSVGGRKNLTAPRPLAPTSPPASPPPPPTQPAPASTSTSWGSTT
ncbi:DeSI-like protein [Dichanthelium oligosanthes]|uniref:DeSI-like protein n=1 Tax=Dichanthelium oligosanthes TaxID=888268 RepID=A0A1E5WB87_9POAL|nr:DeSI-like protein [Dichanthelium oligosanthes]